MSDIPLNQSAIPASGIVPLQAGQSYVLAKTIDLHNCTLMRVGGGPDPVIRYAGMADSAALLVNAGNSAHVVGVTFDCAGSTFAMQNMGALNASNIKFMGGGGLLKCTGATGPTTLQDFEQLSPCNHFGILIGPKITATATGYTEQFNGPIQLINGKILLGSKYMGMVRVHAWTEFLSDGVQISDTAKQSAPGAVQNSTLRLHYGIGKAIIRNSTIAGLCFVGPLNAHDAGAPGSDGGDTLPPGPRRTFIDQERANVSFENVTFDGATVTVAPGGTAAFVKCKNVGTVATPFPYMTRPKGNVTIDAATTRAK